MIIRGDCIEQMLSMEDNSVDAIVTDPPYGLNFMGKKWDYDVPSVEVWKECLRVLKPGAFILSFAGTRTYHRMAVNIEDAGFEIRDMIQWLYGSGFPKSYNIGKGIQKLKTEGNASWNGTGDSSNGALGYSKLQHEQGYRPEDYSNKHQNKSELTEEEAKEWEGWGTALKPANEPIVVARKPLSEKNVALNVLKWGTGGINIDGCRIGTGEDKISGGEGGFKKEYVGTSEYNKVPRNTQGRFPANVILECTCEETETAEEKISGGFGAMKIGMSDTGKGITQEYDSNKSLSKQGSYIIHTNPNCPCKILDEQTEGKVGNGHWSKTKTYGYGNFGNYCSNKEVGKSEYFGIGEKDKSKGGASRFFYCAKASKSERNFGCEELEEKKAQIQQPHNSKTLEERYAMKFKNNHPTVKPIKLMEYLIKLVSKEGAVVLDPFLGSGTTAIAAIKLNRNFIGIEKEEEYVKICNARINGWKEKLKKENTQQTL